MRPRTRLRKFDEKCPEVATRPVGINECSPCPHCIWVDLDASEIRCAFRAKAYWF
jgi:hypothetical protein